MDLSIPVTRTQNTLTKSLHEINASLKDMGETLINTQIANAAKHENLQQVPECAMHTTCFNLLRFFLQQIVTLVQQVALNLEEQKEARKLLTQQARVREVAL
jgi:hypothetical protein